MRRLLLPAVVVAVIVMVLIGLALILTVGKNKETLDLIIDSRVETIIGTCKETNERHADVTATLNRLREEAMVRAKTQAEREAIEMNQRPTRLFIDALVPRRDCQKRARELVPEAFP